MSVRETTRQFGLAYNTAYRLHHLLRTAVLCTAEDTASLKGKTELDGIVFGRAQKGKRGRGATDKVEVVQNKKEG